jgi:hypothetical protein
MKSNDAPAYWVHNLSPFLVRFTDSFGTVAGETI